MNRPRGLSAAGGAARRPRPQRAPATRPASLDPGPQRAARAPPPLASPAGPQPPARPRTPQPPGEGAEPPRSARAPLRQHVLHRDRGESPGGQVAAPAGTPRAPGALTAPLPRCVGTLIPPPLLGLGRRRGTSAFPGSPPALSPGPPCLRRWTSCSRGCTGGGWRSRWASSKFSSG